MLVPCRWRWGGGREGISVLVGGDLVLTRTCWLAALVPSAGERPLSLMPSGIILSCSVGD